jgi:hypothetical protein
MHLPAFSARDAGGRLTLTEPEPGYAVIEVAGSLSHALARALPVWAQSLLAQPGDMTLVLDVRGMSGWEPAVVDEWGRFLVAHRARVRCLTVQTHGLAVTLAARAAAVVLRASGVRFEVERLPAEASAAA